MLAVAGKVILVGLTWTQQEIEPEPEHAFIGMGEPVPEFMQQGVHIDPSDIALLPAFGTVFTFYDAAAVLTGFGHSANIRKSRFGADHGR